MLVAFHWGLLGFSLKKYTHDPDAKVCRITSHIADYSTLPQLNHCQCQPNLPYNTIYNHNHSDWKSPIKIKCNCCSDKLYDWISALRVIETISPTIIATGTTAIVNDK